MQLIEKGFNFSRETCAQLEGETIREEPTRSLDDRESYGASQRPPSVALNSKGFRCLTGVDTGRESEAPANSRGSAHWEGPYRSQSSGRAVCALGRFFISGPCHNHVGRPKALANFSECANTSLELNRAVDTFILSASIFQLVSRYFSGRVLRKGSP